MPERDNGQVHTESPTPSSDGQPEATDPRALRGAEIAGTRFHDNGQYVPFGLLERRATRALERFQDPDHIAAQVARDVRHMVVPRDSAPPVLHTIKIGGGGMPKIRSLRR